MEHVVETTNLGLNNCSRCLVRLVKNRTECIGQQKWAKTKFKRKWVETKFKRTAAGHLRILTIFDYFWSTIRWYHSFFDISSYFICK